MCFVNGVTKLMIDEFNMKKLGYDFMGYTFNRTKDLSFHHLIVPRKDSKRILGNDGYIRENGAILVQDSSHDYLHLIEHINREMFEIITEELIKENKQGYLSSDNIKKIHKILEQFEKEHLHDKSKKGKVLIKYKYLTDRVKFY